MRVGLFRRLVSSRYATDTCGTEISPSQRKSGGGATHSYYADFSAQKKNSPGRYRPRAVNSGKIALRSDLVTCAYQAQSSTWKISDAGEMISPSAPVLPVGHLIHEVHLPLVLAHAFFDPSSPRALGYFAEVSACAGREIVQRRVRRCGRIAIVQIVGAVDVA